MTLLEFLIPLVAVGLGAAVVLLTRHEARRPDRGCDNG
jgi:hypothetical protein